MSRLLEIGLSNAVGATLLALLAWLLCRVLRQPKFAYCLWLIVLAKLLVPPVIALRWVESPLAAWHDSAPLAEADLPLAQALSAASSSELASAPTMPASEAAQPVRVSSAVHALSDTKHAGGLAGPTPVAFPLARPTVVQLLVGFWLLGSLAWVALSAQRMLRFRRLLKRARPADDALQAEVAEVAARIGLKRLPQVRLVSVPMSPLVWALGRRAQLVLPAALLARLDLDQRRTLFAHELAHLRRRDHLVRWIEMLAVAIYWWHPVAWWARRRIHQAGELCCDAEVVAYLPSLQTTYAETLLATVDYLSEARPVVPLGASAISQVHLLKRRLEMILAANCERRLGWRRRLILTALAVATLPWAVQAVAAAPAEGNGPTVASIDARLARLENAVAALTEELQAMRGAQAADAPAKVVKTEPANDSDDVDPNLTEIRVTFSKDMHQGSWSWTQFSDETFPETTGKPKFINKRTAVLPVKLQPGKEYHIGINSERFRNFKDEGRQPAVPYPLNFKTKAE